MIRIDGIVRILSISCRALSSSHKLYFPRKNSLVTESQERWKKYVETIPGMYNSFYVYFYAAETISFFKMCLIFRGRRSGRANNFWNCPNGYNE